MAKASCSCGAQWTGMKVEHCVGCHQTFTGTTAGDKHRVGSHHIETGPRRRRCLTVAEMEAAGMGQNKNGHWMSSQNTSNWPSGGDQESPGSESMGVSASQASEAVTEMGSGDAA